MVAPAVDADYLVEPVHHDPGVDISNRKGPVSGNGARLPFDFARFKRLGKEPTKVFCGVAVLGGGHKGLRTESVLWSAWHCQKKIAPTGSHAVAHHRSRFAG